MAKAAGRGAAIDMEVSRCGSRLGLTWDLGNRRIDPSSLVDLGLPSTAGVRTASLSGRGPLWLFARLGWLLARNGIDVAVYAPQLEGHVVVSSAGSAPLGAVLDAEGRQMPPVHRDGDVAVEVRERRDGDRSLLYLHPPGARLSPAALPGLMDGVASAWHAAAGARLVHWEGSVPSWMAAAVAAWAATRQTQQALGFMSVTEGGVVVVASDPQGRYSPGRVVDIATQADRSTPIYGIVGDPNSGKSVLSWRLYWALQRQGRRVYRYDSDVAAPTADWGLHTEAGALLRKQQKRRWDDAVDVPMLIEALAGIRRSRLDHTLIDLPGGRHAPEMVCRIPELREPLFREIDRYVLVQKSDDVAEAWVEAIQRVHPNARVWHEVLSRRAGTNGISSRRGVLRVAPLEREQVDRQDPAVDRLARIISAELESVI